ncbi:MAG: amidohydrolase family protein [Halobacteriales archaeon]
MRYSGRLVVGREMEVVEGTLHVENGRVAEIERHGVDSDDVVVPAFVNAHTHVGDSLAMEAGRGLSLDEVVAPPDGLKHRILRSASRQDKLRAMKRTVDWMRRSGVGGFLDFREGGVEGVRLLREAVAGSDVEAFAMGRGPPEVLDVADGYGASGSRDGEFADAREEARRREKPFGIHAGERDADDVDGALALEPDFVVHMTHARESDLEWLEETGTPVVVCPRCNVVTDVGLPPVDAIAERTKVALGTDNVMLNSPSLWREMEWTSKLYDVGDAEVLRMATVHGAEVAGWNDVGYIDVGARARFVVLRGDRALSDVRDVVAGVVRRAGPSDVREVVLR